MENSCKLHIYAIIITTNWCHILFFVIRILCDLSKATRPYSKLHVVITIVNPIIYLQIPCSEILI